MDNIEKRRIRITFEAEVVDQKELVAAINAAVTLSHELRGRYRLETRLDSGHFIENSIVIEYDPDA